MTGPDNPLAVLMYHSVSQIRSGPMRSLAVPGPILAEQLGALSEAGYALTGLTEALARRERDPSAKVVALTFDDGYLDLLTVGLDILAAARATATLYVAVGHVGEPPLWMGEHSGDFDRLLTWSEISEVSAAGIEIGNHSFTHTPMDVMSASTVDTEVRESAALLRDRTQTPVLSFAYPHGYNNRRVRAAVAQYGHRTACEVGHRLYAVDGRSLAIPRIQVTAEHRAQDVLDLVRTGGSRLVPLLKDAARPAWWAVRKVANDVFGWTLT
jgi:peptidoglycan/xylan/chitin deacetylase (PgdA/CDA1 family)